MAKKDWRYACSSADAAPATAPILLTGDICDNLRKAAALGYDSIEVHTRETVELDYEAIRACARECGCKVGMVITGRLNTEGKCDLINDIPYIQEAAMRGMKQYIDMAAKLDAGIVIGWVKGKIPAGGNRKRYMDMLAQNLKKLAFYGAVRNVPLCIEVINHYETNIFTTAEETMSFLEEYGIDNCYAHLDTYHMMLEEVDPAAAVRRCKGRLGYVHFADSTRQYPGTGKLEFDGVLRALDEIDYKGILSIECLPIPDGETAAREGLKNLKELVQKQPTYVNAERADNTEYKPAAEAV